MDRTIKRIINEEIRRTEANVKRYNKVRRIVEGVVREELNKRILKEYEDGRDQNELQKVQQVQDALNEPTVNMSALARTVKGLSGNDDARRSEISKIARGEWVPDTKIINDILHKLSPK